MYGASTKGNVLLQYLNIDRICYNGSRRPKSRKMGLQNPGTHIPIISEEDARKMNPDYFLSLPWHFKSEFVERESRFLKDGGKFIFPLPEVEIV